MIIKKKIYRSDIHLEIQRLPGSVVTDEMLAKGSAAGKLPVDKVKLWIEDIVANRYVVVKVNPIEEEPIQDC